MRSRMGVYLKNFKAGFEPVLKPSLMLFIDLFAFGFAAFRFAGGFAAFRFAGGFAAFATISCTYI